MSILATEHRDYARIADQISRRMNCERDDGREVLVEGLHAHKGGSGFSNETLFATMSENGLKREIVVRLGPIDPAKGLFPEYDIPRQYHVMQALERTGKIPVPHCLWLDTGTDIFGSPYYLMDRIFADVPADVPPITVAGFVYEADEEDRERFWWSQIEAMARLDGIDWQGAGLGFLRKDRNKSPIEEQIDYYERCYRWGRGNSPVFPEMERTIRWLRSNMPRDEPDRLCWGDARTSNFMFRDLEVVAMLDWEMAHIGNPECDLAYFLVHHDLMSDHPLPEYSRPRLAGFPSNEETVARFEELIGRKVEYFSFYTAFNHFKNLASMQRFYDLVHHAGLMGREESEAAKVCGGGSVRMMMEIIEN